MTTKKHHHSDHSNRKVFGSLVAAAVATAIGAPNVVWAQTSEATLAGYAAPGANITVRSPSTGLTRHAVANSDGHFVVSGLPPGVYTADAGPGTEQSVTLQVASTTNTDLTVAQLEEVKVTGVRVHQQALTSEVGAVVSLHDIDVLPQVTRNFLEFASTVPGVQFNIDSNGNTSLRGGAQLTSNVNVYIDGVSQKDYVNGGITGQSGPGQAGDPGNPFPQLAIDEYKVVTSNYKAEFGEAASAVILAQTKSGTNQFKGEAFGSYYNQNMEADTPAQSAAGGPKTKAPWEEYGFAEGGPIIMDKLHFFVTWEHKSLSEQNVVSPGGSLSEALVAPLLPAGVAAGFGPTTNPFREDLAFGKLDYEITDSDRIELSGKLREEKSLQGAAGQTAASAASNYKNNDNRWDLHWQHAGNDWVNEARVTHQNTTSNTNAAPNPEFSYYYFPVVGSNNNNTNIINEGGPGAGVGFRYGQEGFGFQDDLTFSNLHWLGDHTVKLGTHYQDLTLTSEPGTLSLADAQYFYAVTPAGTAASPYEVQFPVSYNGEGAPAVSTSDKQFGVYIQDDWAVNRNLLLNLGLRWDTEIVPSWEHFVTGSDVIAALNSPWYNSGTQSFVGTQTYAQILNTSIPGSPAININNYISTGSNRKAPTNEYQPRLGFAYDFAADQQNVLFGGYGRSFDHTLYNTLAYETTKVGLYNNPQIYFQSPYAQDSFGTCTSSSSPNSANHCYAWNSSYLTPAGLATLPVNPSSHEVDLINNNIKAPHSDQFSVGFRSRLGEWDTSATLSDIKSFDQIVGHLGLRQQNGAYYDSTGNQWSSGGSLKGFGGLILWDNSGEDTNLQLGLAATKPYTKESGWGVSIAYTYSDAFQNNVAGGNNPYFGAPNNYLFDLPSPKDYALLPSTAVPKHRIVITGSHDIPWGFLVAGKLELATATNIDFIGYCANVGPACNNGIGGGNTPYSVHLPGTLGYKDLDVQLSKNFKIAYGITGGVRLDVLNIFNFSNFDPNSAIITSEQTGTNFDPYYNKTGNITGFPRTVKISADIKW